MDYGESGASATLDTLNVLRRQLHEDLCSTFALTPADINSAEDIRICTAQVTENGANRQPMDHHGPRHGYLPFQGGGYPRVPSATITRLRADYDLH